VRDLRYSLPVCSVCNKFEPTGAVHVTCSGFSPTYTKTLAFFDYTKVIKRLLGVYKYKQAFQYQREIERLTLDAMNMDQFLVFRRLNFTPSTRVILVPVPMSARKLEERGFSPARELAVIIGRQLRILFGCKVSLCTSLLKKSEAKTSQARKNRIQRLLSLSKEFSVREEQVAEFCATPIDAVILVDDVLTTGATTTAVYEAIMSNNVVAEKLQSIQFIRIVFARA